MKKSLVKVLALLLCIVIAVGLTGCKSPSDAPQTSAPAAPDKSEAPAADEKTAADMVLKNGVIYTMDEDDSVVTALAVVGDELVYVGDDAGAEAYIGENTEVIDLEGKMAAPGFINGHDHIAEVERKSVSMLLFDNENYSIESYTKQIQDYIDEHPDREIVNGDGFDLRAFPNSIPDNDFLNENFPDIPIAMADASGHGILANAKAMELAGIDENTEAPAGGLIYRDSNGKMTGYFSDAGSLFDGVFSRDDLTEEDEKEAMKIFSATANSYGMTAINGGGSGQDRLYRIYDEMMKDGELTLRVNQPYRIDVMEADMADTMIEVLDANQKYVSDYQRVNEVKTIIDGVPEGKTALLLEPYEEAAGEAADYCGPVYWEPDVLNEYVSRINAAGYSLHIHTMGDGGGRNTIGAFKYSLDQNGANPEVRNVVVHGNFLDPADIKLAGEMGIICATQPVWFFVDDQFAELEIQMIGKERFMREYLERDMVDAGMIITGGADYPVTPDYAPLSGIECGVTQGSPYEGQQGDPAYIRNESQTLTAYEMLKVYTINGAYEAHFDDITGSLEVGKKADIVVLGQDIVKCDPLTISETPVIYTIIGGRIVYEG